MKKIAGLVDRISQFLRIIAGILLVFIMSITCLDVIGNFFGHPILGVEELVSILASITMAFVLPIAHKKKAHIGIDILYRRMGQTFKTFDDIFVSLISGALFLAATVQCFKYANDLKRVGEVTSTLQIPKYILLYGVSMGCGVLFLVILCEIGEFIDSYVRKK